MNGFTVVDLAISAGSAAPMPESLRPDYSVAFFVQVIGECAHVRDALFGRWSSPDAGVFLFRWVYNKGFYRWPIFLEGLNAASVAEHICTQAPVTLDLRILPIDSTKAAKLRRGAALREAILAGKVQVDLPEYSDARRLLDRQLRAFPAQVEGHDDMRDCLSLLTVIMAGHIGSAQHRGTNSDAEPPSWAGDPLARLRWEREHPQDDEGSAGLATG